VCSIVNLKKFLDSILIRFGLSILYILSFLPYRVLMGTGKILGSIFYLTARKRRKIAKINLELCFPDDSEVAIQAKLKEHFQALGMAFMELAICWWWSDKRLSKIVHITGLNNIQKGFELGKGIILLSAHFTTLEIGGRLLALKQKVNAVYRKHDTEYFEQFVKSKRANYSKQTIEKTNIRAMIKCLRNNDIVWYAPDQNFSQKNSILASFFNQPAPTNPATARLAKLTQATVIPFTQYRRKDGSGYDLQIMPALKDFPQNDDLADANRINQVFMRFIEKQPSHYYWVHRKFKRLPQEYKDVYAEL